MGVGECDFDGKVDCDGECDSEDDAKDDSANNDDNMMGSQRTPPVPASPGRRTRGEKDRVMRRGWEKR